MLAFVSGGMMAVAEADFVYSWCDVIDGNRGRVAGRSLRRLWPLWSHLPLECVSGQRE